MHIVCTSLEKEKIYKFQQTIEGINIALWLHRRECQKPLKQDQQKTAVKTK